METVDYLIVGAGVTGLAFANAIAEHSPTATYCIIEADTEIGGYCKTVHREGFVWDYSGHFFHFRHPEIESWLRQRMPHADVRTITKRSTIFHRGQIIDFPFQKNIHQLDKEAFIDCLYSLYFRDQQKIDATDGSFRHMVIQRFGRGIAERFLIPYNEKLYATSLDSLDASAMGRFFPHADIDAIIGNMRPGNPGKETAPGSNRHASYNATFSYPLGGAIEYIHALARDLPSQAITLAEPLTAVDLNKKCACTPTRRIRFSHLISSAPLPALAKMSDIDHRADLLTSNKVIVFNLGFDRPSQGGAHWTYFPDPDIYFYRVGFYDAIMNSDRMSLYVEIGAEPGAEIDIDRARNRVIRDLEKVGVITDHQLVAWHHVVLDPAYVHLTRAAMSEATRLREQLSRQNVHSIGRYGAWTYCSIEDNIVEARELATQLSNQPH